MSERGELVMIRTADGEEPGRLVAVPVRLIPFLETLAECGAFGPGIETVIASIISQHVDRYLGTPLLPADVLEEKRRALRTRGQGAALW